MTAGKIVVLATGGTLAGTAANTADNVGYTAAQLPIAEVLARIPTLKSLPLVTEQVAQVDSKDMGFLARLDSARAALPPLAGAGRCGRNCRHPWH